MHRRDQVVQDKVDNNEKYDNTYYTEIRLLARKNGFMSSKIGRVSFQTYIEFLKSKNIELPKENVVINQRRITINHCCSEYIVLLFKAKCLGYKQLSRGRPSREGLELFINFNLNLEK